MPALALSLPVQAVALGVAGAIAPLAAALVYRAWKRARITPEERERRRRGELVHYGKLTDANLVEIRDDMLFYSYYVRGVEYIASQDVRGLETHIPEGLGMDLESVSVRYDSHNPANSIVLAEEWTGLHPVKAK